MSKKPAVRVSAIRSLAMTESRSPLTRVQYHRVTEEISLRQFLSDMSLTSTHIDHLLEYGAIYCNGLRLRQDTTLAATDLMRIHLTPKRFLMSDVKWTPDILFEDDDLLIIDKPGGLPTHPTLDNFVENAKVLCERHFHRDLFVTHRLDVPTQGVLILAKTLAAQKGINKLFRKRLISKIYRAVTDAPVREGSYVHFLDPQSKTPKQVSLTPQAGWLECRMQVKHLTSEGTRIEIILETGRTHQIRAQLAALGSPIIGDIEYGSKLKFSEYFKSTEIKRFVCERIALECYRLSFTFRSQTFGISRPTTLTSPLIS